MTSPWKPSLCVLVFACLAGVSRAEPADFARDVQPVLSKYCYACHGPDKQKSGLRLDQAAAALKQTDSGDPAIVPGQPKKSRLIAVIDGSDKELAMPPKGAKLSAKQVELLRQWIAEGAEYKPHWAFVAPKQAELPAVQQKDWPRNAIDSFVLARLEKEGLSPSPPADRYTLIRRAYLDLIGLPPTPQQVDAFVNDKRPDAYERVVDELLASPHYGERWARKWLDLARYSDTNGYEKDRNRSIWPYRDWVISALNDDMPFDQFTIQQIAGDLLEAENIQRSAATARPHDAPSAGALAINEQLHVGMLLRPSSPTVATGFHRNTMTNEEGGIDVAEFRYHATVDRLNTTAAVWLGLTLGCAQCHTHKYDPFTQREYYQLFAFLDNADEVQADVVAPAQVEQQRVIHGRIADAKAERSKAFAAQGEAVKAKYDAWRQQAAAAARKWAYATPTKMVAKNGSSLSSLPDKSVLVHGDNPNQEVLMIEIPALPGARAIRLEVLPHDGLPRGGPGRAPLFSEGDFHLGEFGVARAEAGGAGGEAKAIALHNASHSFAQQGRSAAAAIDGDPDTAWSIKGGVGKEHQAVFNFKDALPAGAEGTLIVTLDQRYIHQMTIGRFRLSLSADDQPLAASRLPAEIERLLATPVANLSPQEQDSLLQHYLSTSPDFAEINKRIDALAASLPKPATTLVLVERQPPFARVTSVHKRGEFLQPTEVVKPGTPAALHAMPAKPQAANRLDFARWLVSRDNPLTARVAVNRAWQVFFGRGLVRTTEDFGVQGERPTHPDLLDWLAVAWAQGADGATPQAAWSMKRLHKLIVMSATYQQSSRVTPHLLERDPSNVLLSRGPRLRMEAEMLRDNALAVGGMLSRRIGGPSVFPPQPDGVNALSYGGFTWTTSQGEDRHRRGLYTFAKRTTPYPMFITFDGPTGETCHLRRERSNTPLQALTLLNDTVFIEASQALARRVIGEKDDARRAGQLIRLTLQREAHEEEVRMLTNFVANQRERFAAGGIDTAKIAGSVPAGVDRHELAAWVVAARSVMNTDEAMTRE